MQLQQQPMSLQPHFVSNGLLQQMLSLKAADLNLKAADRVEDTSGACADAQQALLAC